MGRESFRERNRRRREENAFENLYAYARSAGIPEPKRSAERAARALHVDRPAADRLARSRAGRGGGDARADDREQLGAADRAGRSGREDARGDRDDVRAAREERADTRAERQDARAERDGARDNEAGAQAEEEAMQDPVPHRLEDRTKEQLYARAQDLDISGRSQMTKDELIEAIRDQR